MVVGIGDRSIYDHLPNHVWPINIAFPGEDIEGLPGETHFAHDELSMFMALSHAFGGPLKTIHLADAVIADRHLLYEEATKYRLALWPDAIQCLCDRARNFGNSVMDSVHGVYHMIKNRRLLDCPALADIPKMGCPAIAVAAGPSLDDHLVALQMLQDKCLIVSAASNLDVLLENGIRVDYVTPHERLEDVNTTLLEEHYEDVIYAGLPVCHPEIVDKFSHHVLVCNTNDAYLWYAPGVGQVFCGQSTGCQAAAIASRLTTGPVYLVGHDLAFTGDKAHSDGHAGGSDYVRDEDCFEVPGYDGKTVKTWTWWYTYSQYLGGMLRDRSAYNTCASGALIPGVPIGKLPLPENLKEKGPLATAESGKGRREALERNIKEMQSKVESALRYLGDAERFTQMTVNELFKEDRDIWLWGAVTLPTQAHFVIQQRQWRDPCHTHFREAMSNNIKWGWRMIQSAIS